MSDFITRSFDAVSRRLVSGSDQFRATATRRLYDWWAGFSPMMPRRADFDVLDHMTIAPHLYLYRFLGDGAFEYRLNGEQVVCLIGRSQRGERFSTESEDPERRALSRYLLDIVSDPTPRICTGVLAFLERQHVRFESLDCPLINDQGRVCHIIGAMDMLPPDAGGSQPSP